MAGQTWTLLRRVALLGMALGMLGGTQAKADDVFGPTWNRSGPSALRAHWGFEDADHPTQPDSVHNPFQGPVQAGVTGTTAYLPTKTGRKGIWVLTDPPETAISDTTTIDHPSGVMTINVPNANRPGQKEVWVQVTYLGVAGVPVVDVPGFTKTGESVGNADADGQPPYTESEDPNPWKIQLTKWTSSTCPASETVKISPKAGGAVTMDQLVIDTICRSTIGR